MSVGDVYLLDGFFHHTFYCIIGFIAQLVLLIVGGINEEDSSAGDRKWQTEMQMHCAL